MFLRPAVFSRDGGAMLMIGARASSWLWRIAAMLDGDGPLSCVLSRFGRKPSGRTKVNPRVCAGRNAASLAGSPKAGSLVYVFLPRWDVVRRCSLSSSRSRRILPGRDDARLGLSIDSAWKHRACRAQRLLLARADARRLPEDHRDGGRSFLAGPRANPDALFGCRLAMRLPRAALLKMLQLALRF